MLFGSRMVCDGPGDVNFHYSSASDGFVGAIHLSCLESPATAARMLNTAVPEPLEEELAVSRSDALALLVEMNDE